ncbi:WecB/TagA/CpsF family glycosyltransferase [Ekhidna sp.]
MKEFEKINILGINVTNLTSKELIRQIGFYVTHNQKQNILYANIHGINVASSLGWFREFFNRCAIVFCDGDGVRLGAKILGHHIYEKITYNRWIWDFASFCESEGISWYLVGSESIVIKNAVDNLKVKYPKLVIVGYRNGFFQNESEYEKLITDLNTTKPNILLLGMGMPHQENLLLKHGDRMTYNVALTGGAVFEYVSGEAKMTPSIFFHLKLEWFFRFLLEPKRLFKRYFIGNPLFFARIFMQKYFNKS